MRFSILIPVYNVELLIDECMESVLSQTYTDFEVILTDDGSTDSSGAICDRYASEYPFVRVIHQENRGIIAARRAGIAAASGEFCVFVDSDDLAENCLLETVNAITEKDPAADVVLYSCRYYRNGEKAERYPAVFSDGAVFAGGDKTEIYRRLVRGNDISTLWTKAVRTELLKSDTTDYSAYYGRNMGEDVLQSLYPLTAAKKIVYTDAVLYDYRYYGDSVSKSYAKGDPGKKNILHVYEKVSEYIGIWDCDREEFEKLNATKWFDALMYDFTKYWENAADKAARERILAYYRGSAIPTEMAEKAAGNPVYRRLYEDIVAGRYGEIEKFFRKKKIRGVIKKIKKSL